MLLLGDTSLLIVSLLEFFGGWWLRGILRSRSLRHREQYLLQREADLTRLQARIFKPLPPPIVNPEAVELDRMLLEDALAREQRAKAALVAVLRTDGCTEDQIEDVMNAVDCTQDGDGCHDSKE